MSGLRELLVRHCAPTLLGCKPAGLIRCGAQDRRAFLREAQAVRRELEPTGVELRVMKECPRSNSFLVYVFRRESLFAALALSDVQEFLRGLGYDTQSGGHALLIQLGKRLCLREEFPHEIGLFLGYPLEDVVGFLRHGGRNCTYCGLWKAYGDPEQARERFLQYDRCTRECCEKYARGMTLMELARAA